MNNESRTLPVINIREGLLFAAIAQESDLVFDPALLSSQQLISWEGKSILHVKTDANNCLELLENESLVIVDETTDTESTQIITAKTDSQGNIIPVQIQTNIPIDSTQDSISTINTVYDDFGNKEELYTFKIKISKGNSFGVSIVEPSDEAKEAETIDYISVPAYIDSSLIKLHDFGSNLTSLSFNNFKNNSCYLDINLNIPTNCYGLMMIYYTGNTEDTSTSNSGAHIYYSKTATTEDLKIFNNIVNSTES
jgi:hypothetical protein